MFLEEAGKCEKNFDIIFVVLVLAILGLFGFAGVATNATLILCAVFFMLAVMDLLRWLADGNPPD